MEEAFESPEPTFVQCGKLIESTISRPIGRRSTNNIRPGVGVNNQKVFSGDLQFPSSRNSIETENRNRQHHAIEDVTTEDVDDGISATDYDNEPLIIQGPARKGSIHQFLSALRLGTNNNNNFNNKNNGSRLDSQIKQYVPCSNEPRHAKSAATLGPNRHRSQPDENVCTGTTNRIPRGNSGDAGTSKSQLGIMFAALSCVFFATTSLIVKTSTVHPMELLAARGFVQGVLVVPIVISTKSDFLGVNKVQRSLLLARGILGSAALLMSFISIHMIPLSDSSTVIFSSPVFVSIFACFCLGELCTWFDILMIILTLLGVILVSKPSFEFINSSSWDNVIGTFCGLAAAMFTALAFIVLRQLKVHYSVTVLWFSVILTCFGSVLTIVLDAFTVPTDWLNMLDCIAVGICGFLGQVLLTKALQIETATTVAITRTLDIVLAFLFQIVFLQDTPDVFSCLGSVLVVSCVVLTACRRRFLESQEEKKRASRRKADASSRIIKALATNNINSIERANTVPTTTNMAEVHLEYGNSSSSY